MVPLSSTRRRSIAVVSLLVPVLLASVLAGCRGAGDDVVANETPAAPDPLLAIDSLREDLPSLLEAAGIPGLAIAVVRDGELVLDLGLGVLESGKESLVTPDTVFEAASLSKPVVALRALQLIEAGQLDLDRPLTEYIAFDRVEGDDRIDQITARHVLSHSTGFPNWSRNQPLTIRFDPGTEFGYSGEGYVFLQQVIEALTGQSLAETVRSAVFEPLGMASSSFVWRPDYDELSATGHDQMQMPRDKWRPEVANAAGSLHTTASDYARFLAEMADPTLITPATAGLMLSRHTEVVEGVGWGLGWGLEEVSGPAGTETLYWHWGDNGVFRCVAAASPGRRLGVVYLTNSQNGLAIAEEVLRRTLQTDRHPWVAWQDYPSYDGPEFDVQRQLLSVGLEGGERIRPAYQELLSKHAVDRFAEDLLNDIGYDLLRRDARAAAVVVFELNVEAYPESWNVYDSLGEALMESGEVAKAITNYAESLRLNPENGNAAAMLQELRNR